MMRRPISIVAGLAASLLLAATAHAAGLGRLTVLSLGEPLSAEIEIVSLAPGEDEGLAARIAAVRRRTALRQTNHGSVGASCVRPTRLVAWMYSAADFG